MLERLGERCATAWLAVASVMLAHVAGGCAVLRIGPPAEVADFDRESEAKQNLDAVRAMRRDLPRAGVDATDERPSPLAPPASTSESAAGQPLPVPAGPAGRPLGDGRARLPWTPPAVSHPTPPDRSVPAYTIPAPGPPQESGMSRCVPDGLGGQRCLR